MMRTSLLLAGAGLLLLLLSWAPWPAGGSPELPAAEPTAAPLAQADFGRALFAAKGCATCHNHAAVTPVRAFYFDGPPDLTHYQPDPEFLRTWLKDPQALRPGTEMPNLELKEAEIEALIAFLGVEEPR